ncbi:MAG: trehalase family glycosidase [Nocardioidaceae bacterium]|nr:trehalase family glycosidase [Nocardioidaceae bacterium]
MPSSLPPFDLAQVPFSRAGSWFGLSPVVAEHDVRADVHLVSHRGGICGVLRLLPLWAGPTETHANPARLVWTGGDGGLVTAVFEGVDGLRIRGLGGHFAIEAAQPSLTPHTGTYLTPDPASDSYVFTSYETGHRYRVTVHRGTCSVRGAEAVGRCERAVLVGPDDDGMWELSIEELANTRPARTGEPSFDQLRDHVTDEFDRFLDRVVPWRDATTPAAALAAYVLWSATVVPAGLLARPAVLMSKHWMDKVWSWDHCLNALALAPGDPELAWHQFLLPFDHQDEHGALPDSVAHGEVLRNFVKPPVHGWALLQLLDRLGTPPPDDELLAAFEAVERSTTWWAELRSSPDRGLPYYQHGNDSGWDNSTVFADGQVLETADVAALLSLQMRHLSTIADRLGLADRAQVWTARAEEVQEALLGHLWDGEQFVSRSLVTGDVRRSRSLLTKVPLVLGEWLPDDVAAALGSLVEEHLTDHGLATEPVDSPDYEPDGYWRGPIWAPSTILLVDGLRRTGHVQLADTVSERFLRLCERSGFAENFDALTGEGLRDRAYTWTASAYLLLAERSVRS